MMVLITCSKCARDLPLSDFYKNRTQPSGYQRYCKICDNTMRTERESRRTVPRIRVNKKKYPNDPIKNSARCKAWYRKKMDEDPEYIRAKGRTASAARRARLSQADVRVIPQRDLDALIRSQNGLCAYCRETPWSQWDHIIPLVRGGRHSIGNLLPVCRHCNYSKHHRLLREWRQPA